MPTTDQKSNRIAALDFTKGFLVLVMVLYHWINYFWGAQDNRYLRFLTPSFIFITGFIISNVYFSRYGSKDRGIPVRLLQRSLKIVAVFFALNLARGFAFTSHASGAEGTTQSWAQSFLNVYVFGNGVGGGQGKAVAFFILVPISYLLFLCALLLIGTRFFRYTFHLACLCLFVCVAILEYIGFDFPNLQLLAIGVLGVAIGYVPIERLNRFVRHPFLLTISYFAYLAAITIWNVVYPLQVIGVLLSVALIYLVGLYGADSGLVKGTIILLGKYSLLGYIAQIAILQVLRRILAHIHSEPLVLSLSFVLAFALTVLCVQVVDIIRTKSVPFDRAYRAVFA